MLSNPSCPQGRLWRCALLVETYDLVAMRKVCGHVSHSANAFCSYCHVKRAQLDAGTDMEDIVLRTAAEIVQAAYDWLNATTKAERKRLFDQMLSAGQPYTISHIET